MTRDPDATEPERNADLVSPTEWNRLVLSAMADGYILADLAGTILETNESYQRMVGHSEGELVGTNIRDREGALSPREVAARIEEFVRRRTAEFETQHLRKDGSLVDLHVRLFTVGRPPAARVAAFVRDVTEQRRGAEVLAAERALSDTLFESLPGPVFLLRHDGRFMRWNAAFEAVSGYGDDEISTMSPVDFIAPADHARVAASIARTLEHGRDQVEVSILSRSGAMLPHLISGVRLVVDESPCVLGMAIDISERLQLAAQLQQAQKMEAIGRLSGGVAHDFNNLLTVILGDTAALQADAPPGLAQELLQEIKDAAERAAGLTRQLLAFSRRQTLHRRGLDLNEVVANTVRMLERIVGEDIRIEAGTTPEPLPVHADEGMLVQILVNLAVNSRDAMPNGGALRIRTSLVDLDESRAAQISGATPGSFACVSVGDSGTGIPSDVLPRIFEPFFTTKDVGRGTGLGLPTVLGIAQQHEGFVEVRSEPGSGAEFRVLLPLANATGPSTARPPPIAPLPGRGERVLVVEDELALRAVIRRTLTQAGFDVLEAGSGPAAVAVFEEHGADIQLLLTDLVLPDGMTGAELAQRFLEQKPDLEIIYTSGYSADAAGHEFPLREGDDFLPKPFSILALADLVRRRLQR